VLKNGELGLTVTLVNFHEGVPFTPDETTNVIWSLKVLNGLANGLGLAPGTSPITTEPGTAARKTLLTIKSRIFKSL
jgi:hypothetical protein